MGQDYTSKLTAYSGDAWKWLKWAENATKKGWTNEGRVQIVQFGDNQDVLIAGTGGTNPVPEPTTMALLGIGLIGLVAVGRKKATQN